MVFAESQNDIDKGIQSMESLLNKDFHRKNFQDIIIHELTANQVSLRLYLILFFSPRTTGPILTKHGKKHTLGEEDWCYK